MRAVASGAGWRSVRPDDESELTVPTAGPHLGARQTADKVLAFGGGF